MLVALHAVSRHSPGRAVEISMTCYIDQMVSKARTSGRRTTMVPVTTMEEIPVLSEQERAALTASLKQAETRVRAGKAVNYDATTFKDRLIGIYRRGKR